MLRRLDFSDVAIVVGLVLAVAGVWQMREWFPWLPWAMALCVGFGLIAYGLTRR